MTAPNGPAQSVLIKATLECSKTKPYEIALVSIHGTGTPLGDPIEVGALGQGLAYSMEARPFTMLANKTCYGHTEGAAGVCAEA